ncbi:MAG TPA: ROK family transcriptional regulator [Acidobacteriota bacterium]|nr:ROK family transcriptional regulator [Acidobacteriota bacterium]HRV08299.1 ROK family transcriptional regulator [Acidobacteriota bacterium]
MSAGPGSRPESINRTEMLRSNFSTILHHIREHGPTSRSALAHMTGLNKATISRLVDKLIQMQLVHEIGEDRSEGRGRRAVLLEINPAGGFTVSAEIGVGFIVVVCADLSAQILWRRQEDTRHLESPEAVLERLAQLIRKATQFGFTRFSRFMGLAIGMPGVVDSADGTLLFAPNLGWRGVPVGRLLRVGFQYPVFVDNEANLAALGEYYYGAARGHEQILYISAGIGVGGGLVQEGHLVTGASGFAGEFGHMTIDPKGRRCNCGNRGCWETQASQAALFRRIREEISSGAPSLLVDLTQGNLDNLTVELAIEAAERGDPVAVEAFRQVGAALGIGIASLINAFNPDLVVFGGSLSAAKSLIFPALKHEVQERVLPYLGDVAHLVCAENGKDNCVLGGIARVCQWVIQNPLRAGAEKALDATDEEPTSVWRDLGTR